MKKLTFILLVLLIPLCANAAIIDTARRITWEGNVGVSGDIPTRDTIYTTLTATGGDDSALINNAIAACTVGQVVLLNPGTFYIAHTIEIGRSNITLRGAGMGVTIIKPSVAISEYGSNLVVIGDYDEGTSKDITSALVKGSTGNITTDGVHGLNTGDVVIIDQLNDLTGDPVITNRGNYAPEYWYCTWCGRDSAAPETSRTLGQVVKVASTPDGTNFTPEIPLYWAYDAAKSPQVTKIDSLTTGIGIEDLTVDNSVAGTAINIQFLAVQNSWLLRVEGISCVNQMVKFYTSYRNTVRSCKFHEGFPASATEGVPFCSGKGYCIWFMPYGSANLIEDNILYHVAVAVNFEGACSGNVVAYNYVHTLYHCDPAGAIGWGLGGHGAHSFMNLFEGNYSSAKLCHDGYWGSSSHNTVFRNKIAAPFLSYTSFRTDVGLSYHSQFWNIVGNVIGTAATETVYESVDGFDVSVYDLRYGGDAEVKSTIFRQGNWDSVNAAIRWDEDIVNADHVLPSSLYLSAKPAWWGDGIWPSIGTDLSPTVDTIPAKWRFDGAPAYSIPSVTGSGGRFRCDGAYVK